MKGGADCRAASLSNIANCSRRGNGTIVTCSNRRPVLENKLRIQDSFCKYLLSSYYKPGIILAGREKMAKQSSHVIPGTTLRTTPSVTSLISDSSSLG